MSASRDDVYRLIGYIERDLRGVNAKLTELRSMLAGGAAARTRDDLARCPRCEVLLAGPVTLASHLRNVHGEDA